MPRTNFVEVPGMPGEGRCRVCDLPYSRDRPNEVADHKDFHRRYLKACGTFGAPVPERERERLISEGLDLMRNGKTLEDRVSGGKKWLQGKYHEHLFGALLYEGRQLSFSEYFARMEQRGLKGVFKYDVAAALAFEYSDRLQP